MYNSWEVFNDFLQEIDVSNHSSLSHKGRIALKHNKPEEEKKPLKSNIWHKKHIDKWKKKKKEPEITIYTDGKKHFSDEHILNISKNHADFRGEKNPMFGRKHSEEAIMKLKMMCRCMKGENNPMHGKKHTDDTKKKISKKMSKPLLVEGRFFNSIKEAMHNIVISIKDLKEKINEGIPGYKILTEEEVKQYL